MTSITNLPGSSNPHFTGRETFLSELGTTLETTHTCVIHGPSGIGKTELATEYARRNGGKYSLAWILRCDRASSLGSGLAQLAVEMGVAESEDVAADVLHNNLRKALAERVNWLLIFDNAVAPSDVDNFLPHQRHGHVIVTTTEGNWKAVGKEMQLAPFGREESMEYLKRRTGQRSDRDADTLAKALGDLPLALEQACGVIEQSQITYAQYLRRFEALWGEFLQAAQQPGDYPSAITMSCELAIRHLTEQEPTAAELLTLCSFFGADEISLAMLNRGAPLAFEPLASLLADSGQLEQAVGAITRCAVGESDGRFLSLHRAIGMLARHRLDAEDRKAWATAALRIAADAMAYTPENSASLERAVQALPHALAAAEHAQAAGADGVLVAKVLNDAGHFLYERGQYRQAHVVLQQALEAARKIYGDSHPRVAAISNNLARAMARMGELSQAREHFEKAIEIDTTIYGYDNPRVATLVNNYGRYHFAVGDLNTARQQFEWAKGVFENHYGGKHQRVAAVINNIGYIQRSSGQLVEAREQLEAALQMAEETYPQGHPDVARIRANLGRVAQAQGDFPLAKFHLEQALVIDRHAHGHKHPDVARDLGYLGDLFMAVKDYPSAERQYQQALTVAESAHGAYHRAVVGCLKKLAGARDSTGDADGAQWCRNRAEAIERFSAGDTVAVAL